jgi:hypothetical protein
MLPPFLNILKVAAVTCQGQRQGFDDENSDEIHSIQVN